MSVTPLESPSLKTTQKVVLPNINLPTYQTLLAEYRERRSSKFPASRGVL